MRYADSYCTVTEKYDEISNSHSYIFTGKCLVTGQPYSVRVLAQELFNYRSGMNIQDAMPSLSADDREFLISGFSPEGWKDTFSSLEEEDEIDSDSTLLDGEEDDSSNEF